MLLVTLGCDRNIVLSRVWRLKNHTKWERTFVYPDRTPQERDENKILRDEMKRRRTAGEENLTIRDGEVVQRRRPWNEQRGATRTNLEQNDTANRATPVSVPN